MKLQNHVREHTVSNFTHESRQKAFQASSDQLTNVHRLHGPSVLANINKGWQRKSMTGSGGGEAFRTNKR